MANDLVQQITSGRLVNAKKIAQYVFAWLLPDDFPPRHDEELDDNEIEQLIIRVNLSDPQKIALWSYIYCVSLLDVEVPVRERAEVLLDQLLMRPSHEKRARSNVDAALKTLSPLPTPRALLEHPPSTLVSAITQSALECTLDSPTKQRILFNLRVEEFQHPRDRDTLNFVRNLPDDLVAKATDIVKRGVEISVLSSGLLVTQNSSPWLYHCYKGACEVLDVDYPPPLYLKSGSLRAYTVGIEEPMIVVESMAASLLDAREMTFVLGRELGHIMADHTKGRSLCEVILGIIAQVNFGDFLASGLRLKLNSWLRYAEFTADRAGYLASQNLESVLRVMLKFSGYPARHYNEMHTRSLVEQAQHFHRRLDESTMDRMFNLLGAGSSDSNSTIVRTKQLMDWVSDGQAERIIQQRA